MMKIKAIVCAVAVGLCFGVRAATGLTNVTLATGENELTAEMNKKANRLIAVAGSVLKLTGAASDGVYTIACSIAAKAGELVIDATGVEDITELRMSGQQVVSGVLQSKVWTKSGSVTVKGVDKIVFGSTSMPSGDSWTYDKVSTLDTQFSFVGADGQPYASPLVTFTNAALLFTKPEFPYTVASGAIIVPFGKGSLDAIIEESVLDADWNIGAMQVDGMAKGTKIKIGAGRRMIFKPCAIANDDTYQWGGDSDKTFEFDVELGGGSGSEIFAPLNDVYNTLKGVVSGTGNIRVSTCGGLTLNGASTFKGDVLLDWASEGKSTGHNTVRFHSASPGDPANAVRVLYNKCVSHIICEPPADETRTFTMGELAANNVLSPNADLTVGPGDTVRIAKLTGSLRIQGGGTVEIGELAAQSEIYVPGGTKLVVSKRGPETRIILEDGPAGNRDWAITGSSSGDPVVLAFELDDQTSPCTFTLGGKVSLLKHLPSGCAGLTVAAGAQIQLVGDPNDPLTIHNLGGSLVFLNPRDVWSGKVGLWVDAACASSIVPAQDFLPKDQEENPFAGDEVGAWKDWRGARDYCFAQLRYKSWKDVTYTSIIPKYVTDQEPKYVWTRSSGNCRLNLGKINGSSVASSSMPAKHVLMVFNGADGGGKALISEANGVFARDAGKSNGIVKGGDATIRYLISTNGVALANPTATPLSGGWQIISLAVRDADESVTENRTLQINGLGGVQNGSDSDGAQRYGEILVFDQEPSEAELAAAEAYLANKWNLPLHTNEMSDVQLQLELRGGLGTYAFDADADLSGHFKGTLDLNGKRVSIPSGSLPYTEVDIPAEGRLLWNDPSLANAIKFSTNETRLLEVWGVYPRNNAGLDLTKGSLCLLGVSQPNGSGDCRPWFSQPARVPGGAEGWLDYSKRFSSSTAHEFLFTKYPIDETIVTQSGGRGFETLTTVRGAYLVLDSSNGGGSTFNSKAGGNDFKTRAHSGGTLADPIWSDACSEVVRAAETRLDGEIVDAADGFTGKPEVLSVFPESNTVIKGLGNGFNEVFGEVLIYSAPHTDEIRRGIEAYLMRKWLGRMPTGYTDFRGATVTGAGTLVAPSPKFLPQFDADFTGALEFGGFDGPFVLNGGTAATNLQDFGDRDVALSSAVTIDITVVKRRAGSYKLVAGTFDPAQTSVSLGTVTGVDPKRVSLRVAADGIYADIDSIGMLMFVR